MRVLIDYRPALRQPSGAGEYTHQLVTALLATFPKSSLDLTVFSSSWKDRLEIERGALAGATAVDRRVPVRLLNLAWHRLGWPPAETLVGASFDITHSPHPLILPARAAAHVITIHDLNFLAHPERARAEIRRDYPALVREHARRADRIIVPSTFTASEVTRRLGVPLDKISLCAPGAPAWTRRMTPPADGYVLFVGTLEPRKNVGALLDAYELLLTKSTYVASGHIASGYGPAEAGRHEQKKAGRDGARLHVPRLVLAGTATEQARPWLDRLARAPLSTLVRHIGYVDPAARRELYEGARLLVQPSLEEGFGLPVLEAMTLGVPVVAANRGSLPEVLGDAGPLVDPDSPDEIAAGIERILEDEAYAARCADQGVVRARQFRWDATARRVYDAYQLAIEHRQCASV